MSDDLQIRLQPKQWQLREAVLAVGENVPTTLGFGGSRGCAKSGAIRYISIELVSRALDLAISQPGIVVWIVRRVWDDLNKNHVKPLFEEFPSLKQYWHAQDRELKIPVGTKSSSIFFIHAGDKGRSKRKARGPQATFIFIDQAEEFTQEEIEQYDGSNRAPGFPPGFCKKILTFNPGGVGTAYLRRVFHLRKFDENENPQTFMFIQGYGWDNYEWFRGLGISRKDFYSADEYTREETFEHSGTVVTTNRKRFDLFINCTDFGRKLNGLRPSERIGELMGSFTRFSGQYYADVWDSTALVLPAETVTRIVKPWWKRWLATDWGFSHWAPTLWATVGLLSPDDVHKIFNVRAAAPVPIVIVYRECVVNDTTEPDLAKLIVALTPRGERREVRLHFIGHDAFAKKGSSNTVVEQMDPELVKGGMQPLQRADIDRMGGWRLLYNCWAEARKLRNPENGVYASTSGMPCLFISDACVELQSAIPMLICDPDNPQDVQKVAGAIEDDLGDCVRYLVKSYLSARYEQPGDVTAAETYQKYQDPTDRAMAMLVLKAAQARSQRLERRRRF